MEELWEGGIIEALQQDVSWCGVLPYPERPQEYFLKHKVGEILVRYEGSRYGAGDAEQVYQPKDVQVELVLVWRRLRGKEAGAQGLYHTLGHVRQALYNLRLANAASGMQLVQEDMLGENQGVWQYGMKWTFKAIMTIDN